jgi:hypothetical protein
MRVAIALVDGAPREAKGSAGTALLLAFINLDR